MNIFPFSDTNYPNAISINFKLEDADVLFQMQFVYIDLRSSYRINQTVL